MRRPAEIAWRLRQEAQNLWLLARPPVPPVLPPAPLPRLPAPEELAAALRGSVFAEELERLADRILAHRFPLLGLEIETGPVISWRRDYLRGIETPPRYFRLIPYLDPARSGDHKLIWELNRHQHLVVLAQAWLITGHRRYLDEIRCEIDSWLAANPFQRGINWASALEVAFRALSWMWVYHLAGGCFDEEFRRRWLAALYRHGCHIETNLSIYFSPNTHLLIEAVVLHVLGVLFPAFPRAARWRQRGAELVAAQMDAQVRPDGSHFEQSSYYHVYALDAFLFHAVLEEVSPAYRERLAQMARWLAAVVGPERELVFLGDDDGGRFFHPWGARSRFARATLATAALVAGADVCWERDDLFEQALWWLGRKALLAQPRSQPPTTRSGLFADSGLVVLHHGPLHVLFDAGGLGAGSAGHSHSDTLHLVLRHGGEPLLIDPGTYTYTGDAAWRERFRGSAAHNTLRIDQTDQAEPAGPFRWQKLPTVERSAFEVTGDYEFVEAACRYRGFRHRRRLLLWKDPLQLLVFDDVEGAPGAAQEPLIEQFWHPGLPLCVVSPGRFRLGASAALSLAGGESVEAAEGGDSGWRSPAFGTKAPAVVVRSVIRSRLPVALAAVFVFEGEPAELALAATQEGWSLTVNRAPAVRLLFPRTGGWRRLQT